MRSDCFLEENNNAVIGVEYWAMMGGEIQLIGFSTYNVSVSGNWFDYRRCNARLALNCVREAPRTLVEYVESYSSFLGSPRSRLSTKYC